jgi:putative redox protein
MDMIISFENGKKVNAAYNDMLIKTDQSVMAGGEGSAPEPFTLFLASIGTCAGFYIKAFCDKRGISAAGIKIVQSMQYNPARKMTEKIIIDIQLPEDFPEKYRDAVINAADLCTVKRHLLDPPVIQINTSQF